MSDATVANQKQIIANQKAIMKALSKLQATLDKHASGATATAAPPVASGSGMPGW